MRQITVVCTRHEESGNCNSTQLFSILEKIRPSVIFEELSLENFDKAYVQNNLFTLETDAIKSYRINKEIKQFPVDTYPRTRIHDESVDRLNSKITGGITQDVSKFQGIVAQLESYTMRYGFNFLNSAHNDLILNELDMVKERILNHLNDERLHEMHKAEVEMIKNRDNEMLKNIYELSKKYHFDEAVMFIGSGHRRSIFPLIEKFKEQAEIEINWKNYL